MPRVVVLDNFDSFTFNVAHLLVEAGAEVTVCRADVATPASLAALEPDLLVISPGPGHPRDAHVSLAAVRAFAGKVPVFGVCLGMQVLALVFGGEVGEAAGAGPRQGVGDPAHREGDVRRDRVAAPGRPLPQPGRHPGAGGPGGRGCRARTGCRWPCATGSCPSPGCSSTRTPFSRARGWSWCGMCCAAITEHWTARPARLGVEDFLALPGREPFALLYGDGPGADWLLFAEGPLLVADGVDLPELTVERVGEVPPIRPDWIGFASYEAGYALDPVLPPPPALPWRFPLVHLAVYRSLRLYHRPSGTLYEARRDGIAAPREPSLLRARQSSAPARPGTAMRAEAYAAKVARIREEIRRGNVYQVNLTRQEAWSYQGSLLELARRLYAANPAPFSGLIAGTDFAVLSSSPERFVRISGATRREPAHQGDGRSRERAGRGSAAGRAAPRECQGPGGAGDDRRPGPQRPGAGVPLAVRARRGVPGARDLRQRAPPRRHRGRGAAAGPRPRRPAHGALPGRVDHRLPEAGRHGVHPGARGRTRAWPTPGRSAGSRTGWTRSTWRWRSAPPAPWPGSCASASGAGWCGTRIPRPSTWRPCTRGGRWSHA